MITLVRVKYALSVIAGGGVFATAAVVAGFVFDGIPIPLLVISLAAGALVVGERALSDIVHCFELPGFRGLPFGCGWG